jgi:hypothetical protein
MVQILTEVSILKMNTCFFVDQTKPDTFDLLCEEGAEQYDLIIGDGLHASSANINSLTFALSKISSMALSL